MPSPYSSPGSVDDALALARNLGIRCLRGPDRRRLSPPSRRSSRKSSPVMPEDATEENMQARLRGMILMALSNKYNHLLLTTGNKSELAVGYCTIYGDMAGGLAVISDLPKTLVYQLARWINREREIIPGTPSTNRRARNSGPTRRTRTPCRPTTCSTRSSSSTSRKIRARATSSPAASRKKRSAGSSAASISTNGNAPRPRPVSRSPPRLWHRPPDADRPAVCRPRAVP